MPVNTWHIKIDLADLIARWNQGDYDIPELAEEVVGRLKQSGWREITPYPHTFDEHLAELEKASNEAEYIGRWETLYDLADADGVWVQTF